MILMKMINITYISIINNMKRKGKKKLKRKKRNKKKKNTKRKEKENRDNNHNRIIISLLSARINQILMINKEFHAVCVRACVSLIKTVFNQNGGLDRLPRWYDIFFLRKRRDSKGEYELISNCHFVLYQSLSIINY